MSTISKIYNFDSPLLGQHNCMNILSLSVVYTVQKDFYINIAISIYDLYGHLQAKQPLPCGDMKFTILLIFNMSKIKEGYSIRFNSIQFIYQLRALKGQQENCT